MSLLIDALRKAEEQKRRAEPERPPGARPLGDSAPSADARAARNLFEVKASPRALSFPVLVALLTTLALMAIGIYFWLQLNPPGPRLVAIAPPPDLPPLPPATAAPTVPARTAEAPLAPAPQPAAVQTRVADVAPTSQAAPDSKPARARVTVPRAAAVIAPAPAAASRPTPAPANTAPQPVVRRSHQPAVAPALEAAWRNYQAGHLAKAAALYQQVLSDDPRSADALNGMASIAARAGHTADAAGWFQRTLDAQPDNAVAIAGLSALQTSESRGDEALAGRLKSAVARQPGQAALHFALGNALATESRWAEAQSSYFKAYGLDKDNPDYLFNLGVSLDQLGKRDLALRFYGEALAAARTRPHAFDTASAEARLVTISGKSGGSAHD